MIEFLKSWSNQIIVAVIIATIIEMILPNSNNKKYIKMIIGIYVLFTMIQPIITKLTGQILEISNFNYEKYFDEDILDISTNDFEDNNSKLIKQAYIDNIENDIKVKLKQKGYELSSCNVEILENINQNEYGKIKSIELNINKLEETENIEKETTNNVVKIEDVNVDIGNNSSNIRTTNNTKKEEEISERKKKEIIEYLSEEYSVDRKNIIIN